MPLPPPPQWIERLPTKPAWWSESSVSYNEKTSPSSKMALLKKMETHISEMVRKGIPPVKERRQLIKYISLWTQSPGLTKSDLRILRSEIAKTYEELGEYRMAAKEYTTLAASYPRDVLLYSLALEYERVGDRQSALQIYHYMTGAFETNSIYFEIGTTGAGCLNPSVEACPLQKPDWWNQYANPPMWWRDLSVTLPKFTCFQDGRDFIVNTLWNTTDPRKVVKAWALLAKFRPMTATERIFVLLSMSHAYSDVGDHHRAIKGAWEIPVEYSCNRRESIRALKFIVSEFEKLGEGAHALEIQKAIACIAGKASRVGNPIDGQLLSKPRSL